MPKSRPKVRADALVVELGLAEDPARAAALIMSGVVVATDPAGHERRVEKAGDALPLGTTLRVSGKKAPFVSRAGHKLEGALDALGIDVAGRVCADIGLSTGGFTDCLLGRGAAKVHGVDVSYGIVAWRIRTDSRVVLHERTNARTLAEGAFGEPVALIVSDLSFISLTAVLPALERQLGPDGSMVLLVKPQFELPREDVEGGVVRDPARRREAIDKVVAAASALGLELVGEVPSSLPGRDGNVEHFIHLKRRRPA